MSLGVGDGGFALECWGCGGKNSCEWGLALVRFFWGGRRLPPPRWHVILKSNRMEIQFTPDHVAFVRRAIESGRLHHGDEAVKEALSLWEERERRRVEILSAIDEAEASLEREPSALTLHPEPGPSTFRPDPSSN